MTHPLTRARSFAERFGLDVPILMAPMAGACPPDLAIAVANGGGMGACGALLMEPEAIGDWVREVRSATNGAFQLNTWIPDDPPKRDAAHEDALRIFLAKFGPEVPQQATEAQAPDFAAQCRAMIQAGPAVMSSIMGLYPEEIVAEMKQRGIKWFATVTSVTEAIAAQKAGADVLIAQGSEAGGHRGSFTADTASQNMAGLFSLLPLIVDATNLPVVATGGIADARQVSAALMLGASGVQIGTALLRAPEAGIPQVWADALENALPENTAPTRAFSGRLGRALRTDYVGAAADPDAPEPAPYPIQRHLTGPMRNTAVAQDNLQNMQAWAGQSARLTTNAPAAQIVQSLWQDTQKLLG